MTLKLLSEEIVAGKENWIYILMYEILVVFNRKLTVGLFKFMGLTKEFVNDFFFFPHYFLEEEKLRVTIRKLLVT